MTLCLFPLQSNHRGEHDWTLSIFSFFYFSPFFSTFIYFSQLFSNFVYFSRKKTNDHASFSISLSFQLPLHTHLCHTVHHLQPNHCYLTTYWRLMHTDAEIVTKDKKEIKFKGHICHFLWRTTVDSPHNWATTTQSTD